MMDQEPQVYIAVIPPQATDATDPSSGDFFNQHRSKDFDYQSTSPTGSPGLSSEGYPSSPDTPSDLFQGDLAHAIQAANSPFMESLGLWDSQSPSSLSPAFGFLNLGDGVPNQLNPDFGNAFGSDNGSLKVDQTQQTRASLSPLTIPHTLGSPQPSQSLEDDLFAQYLTPEVEFAAQPFDNAGLFDSLSVPNDMNLHQQQQRRSSPGAHVRANSEMNVPWSGSVSPSVVLTPSEPSTSPSFLLPGGPTFDTEDYCLANTANLMRRHSHTGVGGQSGFARGRSEGRSPPSSRGSSRGSSPYSRPPHMGSSSAGPALGPTGMSISPTQIFSDELSQHLTVPQFEGHHHHARRHSFTLGVRPEPIAGGMFEMDPFIGYGNAEAQSPMSGSLTPVSTPTTPITPSRSIPQVASQAGISASERRRTKPAKFACPACPQTFTTNHNLKNHINAHNGVKKHQCEYCGRAFTTASVLARHCKTCKAAPHHS